MMLEEAGIYRLGDSWYRRGRRLYLEGVVPQWFGAIGNCLQYLIYKTGTTSLGRGKNEMGIDQERLLSELNSRRFRMLNRLRHPSRFHSEN